MKPPVQHLAQGARTCRIDWCEGAIALEHEGLRRLCDGEGEEECEGCANTHAARRWLAYDAARDRYDARVEQWCQGSCKVTGQLAKSYRACRRSRQGLGWLPPVWQKAKSDAHGGRGRLSECPTTWRRDATTSYSSNCCQRCRRTFMPHNERRSQERRECAAS